MKIVILEPLGIPEKEISDIGKTLTDNGHEIVSYEDKTDNMDILKKRAEDAEVLIIANMPLKRELILSCQKLKMISVAFTGVDHVDLDACEEKNITVCNCAGYSTQAVAELAVGLMISLMRNIVPLDEKTKENKTKEGFTQKEIFGKTLGIIGTGAIGKKVAEIGAALGCNILAYNRSEKEDVKKLGAKYVELDTLLSNSDIVSVHLPLNNRTRGLISKEKLDLMKPDSILINTSRGPIVDNKSLAYKLKRGEIAGAGIDVFDMEPPLPKDYCLLNVPNTVLTPHIGFASEEAMERRAKIALANISKWIEGNPQNIII